MTPKTYLSANQLTRDSFVLARQIHDSGFRPDAIIALWRGGSPVAIAVQEFLRFKGIDCYHTIVKCTSYTGIEQRVEPQIENLDYVRATLNPSSRVLVVDDIFDSGATAQRMREALGSCCAEVRIATPYYKPSHNTTRCGPDYYVRKTEDWLVFPHELLDLTSEEIQCKDPFVHALLMDEEPAPCDGPATDGRPPDTGTRT